MSPLFAPGLAQDARCAWRSITKSPLFACIAMATLALGIGANTAIFSVVDAVLLKTLPVRDPGELFLVSKVGPTDPYPGFSYPMFGRLRGSPGAPDLAAFSAIARFGASVDGGPAEPARGQLVSGGFFPLLGVRAAAGRMLALEDDRSPGAHPVAVLGHGYWKRRFGGDPAVVGRTLSINGAVFTIVGAAPPEFFGVSVGSAPDLWLPLMMQEQVRYNQNAYSSGGRTEEPWVPQENVYWLTLMARVPAPESAESVAAMLTTSVAPDLTRQAAESRIALTPGSRGLDQVRRRLSEPLMVLTAMAGLILLIACANVANLLLARTAGRRREIAVRLAVGAGRGRLVRQLLTESALLALAGGALGLLVARWGTQALLGQMAGGPRNLDVQLDHRLLLFAAALSLGTTLLFGLAPALKSCRLDLARALKADARQPGSSAGLTFGKLLVVSQVALSLVLLFGAGLFARSLRNLSLVAPGFDRVNVLSARLDLRSAGYRPSQLADLYQRLIERVRGMPGVRYATVSLYSPASGSSRTSGIHVPGHTPRSGERSNVQENLVGPGYFATLGMTLLRGRDFDARDSAEAPPVAIVNETMARHHFAGRDPIGLRFGYGPGHRGFEIVGVVQDAKVNGLRGPAPRLAYRPLLQEIDYAGSLDIRTGREAAALAGEVRRAVAEVDRAIPVLEVNTLAEQVERTLAQEKAIARLTAFFGVLAVALACLGLYGVTSYGVARRTGEIGVRMALGASGPAVCRLVLGETLRLVAIGVGVGLPLALGLTRLIASQLFGLTPADPATLVAVTMLLVAVAATAGFLPARRASRIEPMAALRQE